MARTYHAHDQGGRTCRSTSLPCGITKLRPIRRSPRLQEQRPCQYLVSHDRNGFDAQPALSTRQYSVQKRKRATSDLHVRKRQRSLSTTAHEETTSDIAETSNPIDYWRKYQRWPQTFFESDSNMDQLHSLKASLNSSRKNSTSAPSSHASTSQKSSVYQRAAFTMFLNTLGSFLDDYESSDGLEEGPSQTSRKLCLDLLEIDQDLPQDTLFSDKLFEKTSRMIQERNEAKVVQDIARLIVPSAEHLFVRGARHLGSLVESVDEIWTNAIPLHRDLPRPKPDYSVGFEWSSFTKEQLKKLNCLGMDILDRSSSRCGATYYMYFPFLTCEVTCGAGALDFADRKNAHSATIALRAMVELFRLVKREKELHREILAFSVSHDHNAVRIYGHYPIIDGKVTKYYRYKIRAFYFTVQDGKEKWTAYKFTKNVYEKWMPGHFKWICSAIDEIPPDISFDVARQSELNFATDLPSELESVHYPRSESPVSASGLDDRSSSEDVGHTTPDTSVSQTFKKPRRGC